MSEHASYSLRLDPDYLLTHNLPPHGDTFREAQQLADIVLQDPDNIRENHVEYNGIKLDTNETTASFQRAIPGTDFLSLDIAKVYTRDSSKISLYLHDARRAGRVISLVQEDEDLDSPYRNFLVTDSLADTVRDFPYIVPPVKTVLASREVELWLELQLWGNDASPIRRMSLDELCDMISNKYQVKRVAELGSVAISNSAQFHAQKEESTQATNIDETPYMRAYNCWLTADYPYGSFSHTDGTVTLRAWAGFNANELNDPANTIRTDIEASGVRDPEELTRQSFGTNPNVADLFKQARHRLESEK